MAAPEQIDLLQDHGPNPLCVSAPSPTHLINYPLFVTSVKVLCDQDCRRSRGSSSLLATLDALRSTVRAEGVFGLYRGGHIYILHMAFRDTMRFVGERVLRLMGCRLVSATREPGDQAQLSRPRQGFKQRLALKYAIEAVCYPILLFSTRAIILRGDPSSPWDQLCCWCKLDGPLSLFNGLFCHLLAQAVDETMEVILGWCINHAGSDLDIKDKFILKSCGQSVAAVFTSPITHVGIIQRCQSPISGLLEPRNLRNTIWGLPWRSSFYQFLLFSGILGLNVTVIKAQKDMDQRDEEE